MALLEQASVFVHLDPRRSEVRVPEWFKKQPQLTLQIGLNLPVPIRDLHVDDEGASCTLSFNRTPHLCFFPWPSVFAMVGEDGRGMVWPDDVPPEVAAQQAQQASAQKKKKRARPKLRAVGDGSRPPGEDPDGRQPKAGPEKQTASNGARVKDEKPAPAMRPTEDEAVDHDGARDDEPPAKGRALPPYLRVVK